MAANPVKAFMDDAVTEDAVASDSILKIELHNVYLKFCKNHKIASKTIELFGKDIKKMKYEEKRITLNKERKNVWYG